MHSIIATLSILSYATSFANAAIAAKNFEGEPALNLQVGEWKYVGRADEVDNRALPGRSYSDDDMTIESCQAFCKKNNFPLARVDGCNKPDFRCSGNKKQFCGGNSRVSIFNNTNFAGPGPLKTTKTGWQYQSCFMESQGPRALEIMIGPDNAMTIEMCIKACGDAMYEYAGLDHGRECWCGHQLDPNLEDASDPSCAIQCDMVCGGNGMQICGGRGAISIYHNGPGGVTNAMAKKPMAKRDHHADDHAAKIDTLRARKGRFFKVRKMTPKDE